MTRIGAIRACATTVAAAILLLAVAGCAAPPAPLAPDAPPEQVAGRYFELRAAGDEDGARRLMWRPERFDRAVPDGSFRGLTDLTVGQSREDSAAHRPAEYRAFAHIRLLRAEYVRHRRDSVGTPPGRDGRFVLLGRENADAPWLILEIGTGP